MIELSGRESGLWRMGVGGDSFNVAVYAKALLGDGDVAYVTALGEDVFSRRIRDFMAERGIAADRIRSVPERLPGLYAISLSDCGERSFSYWRGESAARLVAEDRGWLDSVLGEAGTIYFSGITLAILDQASRARLVAALKEKRAAGARIAFDPNFRESLWNSAAAARGAIEQACRIADVVLPTFSDEAALFGDDSPGDTLARLAAWGVPEIAVKNGGGLAEIAAPGARTSVPARQDAQVRDTTGAGDSFNGGYLAARLLGRNPAEAARLGHAVAAQVVAGPGAIVPLDREKALRDAG